jgi:putative Mn2+ efflux pump MntP
MNPETLLIAVGLGMDTFAVGLGSGTVIQAPVRRSLFRLSFHFGLFQTLLFLAGYFAGSGLVHWIEAWDHYLALALLCFVGLRMIREGLSKEDAEALRTDPSKGWRLVVLSVATSIDALAVGLSFGVLEREAFAPALLIGAASCAMTLFGIFLGRRLQARFGKYAEILGGLILVGIGVKIFLEATMADACALAFLRPSW